MRVLVVDDTEDTRQLHAHYLERNGFAVQVAGNVIEGLVRAIASRPDAIVVDVSVPRVDGCEATRRLKSAAATRVIPVIVLSTQDGRIEDAVAAAPPRPVREALAKIERRSIFTRRSSVACFLLYHQ